MAEKSRSFIEAECLNVARLHQGCKHLKAVAIARTGPPNGNPNWEVLAFNPELPSAVRTQAIEAIETLRGRYVLAPFVPAPKADHRKATLANLPEDVDAR
jgi:hypothetical protein